MFNMNHVVSYHDSCHCWNGGIFFTHRWNQSENCYGPNIIPASSLC